MTLFFLLFARGERCWESDSQVFCRHTDIRRHVVVSMSPSSSTTTNQPSDRPTMNNKSQTTTNKNNHNNHNNQASIPRVLVSCGDGPRRAAQFWSCSAAQAATTALVVATPAAVDRCGPGHVSAPTAHSARRRPGLGRGTS